MKKSLLALAVLGAFSGIAAAQSSVTVFGVIDVDVRNVKNGSTDVTSLSSDGYSNSRLGFRGVEDLGGGLKAGFWLESALNADSGTVDSTRFFGRRSTVSLLGGFGEIRLGRDFTPTYTSWSDYAVFGTNGSGASSIFMNNVLTGAGAPTTGTALTATRADNEVSYFLPAGLGGLFGQVSVAAGESTPGAKYIGGRIGYAVAGFSGQVGYSTTEVTPNAVVNNDDQFTRLTFGASYDFGVVKLLGFYAISEWGPRKSDIYEIGASVPVGAGIIRASYSAIDQEGGTAAYNSNDADKWAIGYIHNLSKRTALYATYGQVNNESGGSFNVASAGPLTGVTANPAIVAGQKSTGYELGIRHNF